MRSIKEIEIEGKTLFMRVDFNVPMDQHQNITEDTRIKAVMPTLKYALDNNCKVVIASHMGRPGGERVPELSLTPVAKRLARIVEQEVIMAPDCVGPEVDEIVSNLSPGEIVLLENLRFHREEQSNDAEFARKLVSRCDIYVNNAFAVSHRVHASIDAVTRHVPLSVAGFLLQKEIDYFKKAIDEPMRPLVAIVGGAKVSSKLHAIENMLQVVDKLIIGGAMANTFLRSIGYNVGNSMIEEDLVGVAGGIISKALEKGIKLYLPVDAVIAEKCDARSESKIVPIQEIPQDWMALDIGPATSLLYSEALYDAKTIVWNGPMGVFEIDAFSRGSIAMVHNVANSYALTIVGGGDTDVVVHKAGETERITYISTGGGAFLYLMEGKTLPAVIALDAAEKNMETTN